ncbi:MAG: hypothetical protein KatS3mg031_2628 [Chitinophagales bacterium]|nr:MAG: hypothetical protein KatS3mg031_2628 [Chitinophagales bacterium]
MEPGLPDYSIVVPVYNSGSGLLRLVREFEKHFIRNNMRAELILVDDGSDAATRQLAGQLAREKAYVTTILLQRNYGQLAATTCGIRYARGQIILTLDDDLQYPMEEALKLIDYFQHSGKQIVFGYPRKRKHPMGYRLLAFLFITVFDYLVLPRYRHIHFYTSFRIFRRSFFFDIQNRFTSRHLLYFWEIPPEAMDSVAVAHEARQAGASNYNLTRIIRHLQPPLLLAASRLCLLLSATLLLPLPLFFVWVQTGWLLAVAGLGLFCIFASMTAQRLLRNGKQIHYTIDQVITCSPYPIQRAP